MCRDLHLGKERVGVGVELLEDRRDVEAVDEEGRAARTIRVGKEMEKLETTWVGLSMFRGSGDTEDGT